MNTNKTKSALILVGGLALAALPAALASDAADKFKLMDSDGDGRVSRAEHATGAQAMFAHLDTNNDGILTVAELDAGNDMKKTSKLKFWDKKDELSSAEKIRVIDLNGDGQVTRAEHEAGTETMFARMDTNNDGYLSKDECEKGQKLLEKHNSK